jgi:hypothetical protein
MRHASTRGRQPRASAAQGRKCARTPGYSRPARTGAAAPVLGCRRSAAGPPRWCKGSTAEGNAEGVPGYGDFTDFDDKSELDPELPPVLGAFRPPRPLTEPTELQLQLSSELAPYQKCV